MTYKLINITVLALFAVLSASCGSDRKSDRLIHSTHAYDVIQINDTIVMTVPTGYIGGSSDTVKCQMFKLNESVDGVDYGHEGSEKLD